MKVLVCWRRMKWVGGERQKLQEEVLFLHRSRSKRRRNLQQSHLMAAFSTEQKSHQDRERLGSLCPRYGRKRVFNFQSNPSQKKIGLGCKYVSSKGKTYLFHKRRPNPLVMHYVDILCRHNMSTS